MNWRQELLLNVYHQQRTLVRGQRPRRRRLLAGNVGSNGRGHVIDCKRRKLTAILTPLKINLGRKYPPVATRCKSRLPPRSMVGRSALNRLIGVRIPGRQPSFLQLIANEVLRVRSGFRQRTLPFTSFRLTPARRLNFESLGGNQSFTSAPIPASNCYE
jgi:hypothetical protein